MITKLNIPCVWGGHLAGILMKAHSKTSTKPIAKIIGIHGWLDNLNSMIPLAKHLIERHSNYEIYLYDRAGHGFSSHYHRGSDYSYSHHLRDLRTITQTLGWNKEKYSFIGHSYGAILAMGYAAAYPEEIACMIALDAILGNNKSSKEFWKQTGISIDKNLQYHSKPPKSHQSDLTYEKAIELVRSSRTGIDDESAKLLVERSIRRDKHNKLHFTRDESLKNPQLTPLTDDMVEQGIKQIKAPMLFIGTIDPQWPVPKKSIELLKEFNRDFEMRLIDGSHHFHMTNTGGIFEHIDEYFNKHIK